MITIIYKSTLNRYIINEVKGDCGDEILIKLSEPTDASLMIVNKVFHIECGTAKIKCRDLNDGRITPCIYKGNRRIALEGFILKGGVVIREPAGDELSREIALATDSLSKTVAELSERISALEDKVNGKIVF